MTVGVPNPPKETRAARVLEVAAAAFETVNGLLPPDERSGGGFFCVADAEGEGMFCSPIPRRADFKRDESEARARSLFATLAATPAVEQLETCIRVRDLFLFYDGFLDSWENRAACLLTARWEGLVTLEEAIRFANPVFQRLLELDLVELPT